MGSCRVHTTAHKTVLEHSARRRDILQHSGSVNFDKESIEPSDKGSLFNFVQENPESRDDMLVMSYSYWHTSESVLLLPPVLLPALVLSV